MNISLLGLSWVSAPSRQLKALPQGEAVRRVLGRRMAEEASMLRSNRWSGRDAESQGCLRLFAAAPPGANRVTRPLSQWSGSTSEVVSLLEGQRRQTARLWGGLTTAPQSLRASGVAPWLLQRV